VLAHAKAAAVSSLQPIFMPHSGPTISFGRIQGMRQPKGHAAKAAGGGSGGAGGDVACRSAMKSQLNETLL
jgi:hypothetical protein